MLNLIYTDIKSNQKEAELEEFFELIEIDYRNICTNELRPMTQNSFDKSIFKKQAPSVLKTLTLNGQSHASNKPTDPPLPGFRELDSENISPREESDGTQESRLQGSMKKYLLPPIDARFSYTIVLDLDETLIHSKEKNGETKEVLVRPYAREFIKNFGKVFELVVFTAAVKEVSPAQPVRRLDPR